MNFNEMKRVNEKKEFNEKVKITKNNYINMTKRLYQNKNFINFILIYYSTFLILSSVTAKYFEWYNSELDSYFNIIFSVVLLVTSLINANAKYLERIEKINATIIKLETLEYSNDLSNKEYKSIIEIETTPI